MVRESGHLMHLEQDHARCAERGLRTIRESIGWRISAAGIDSRTQRPRYDFTRARLTAQSAHRHGLQVLWSLMHYGTPPGVDLRDDSFIDAFVDFAVQAAREVSRWSDEPPIYTPINEINFICWAVTSTHMVFPYGPPDGEEGSTARSGFDIKVRLVKATLAAIAAIRAEDPRARFMHVEPVLHVVAPADRPDLEGFAEQIRGYQWQSWDMLGGLMMPELGGTSDTLDLVGVNYYHSGQWEAVTEERLLWHLNDPRRIPFSRLLAEAAQRYDRPITIAETSHVGIGRGTWLDDIASQVEIAQDGGAPVQGICLYPVVDRPDWHDPAHWHHSGLWDVEPVVAPGVRLQSAEGTPFVPQARVICEPYAQRLAYWQQRLPAPRPGDPR